MWGWRNLWQLEGMQIIELFAKDKQLSLKKPKVFPDGLGHRIQDVSLKTNKIILPF